MCEKLVNLNVPVYNGQHSPSLLAINFSLQIIHDPKTTLIIMRK